MKRIKRLFTLLILLVLVSLTFSIKLHAYKDLDRIHLYDITVDPDFNDGTLDISIHIIWEVLDSSSEGPLEWVKIGIPNYHTEIKTKSDNISKIKYSHDDGSFIRIDFKDSYFRGDIVDFSFSFKQSHMYFLKNDKVYYDYNPGYFDEILVDECNLRWNMTNSPDITKTTLEGNIVDGYYVLSSSLGYGEYIKINLSYDDDLFTTLDPKMQYTSKYLPPKIIIKRIILVVLIVGVIGFILFMSYKNRDKYQTERGFIHMRGTRIFFMPMYRYHNGGYDSKGKAINVSVSSSGSHSGGSCACACACACAGGGRAGCSMKDFYGTNLKSQDVMDKLK